MERPMNRLEGIRVTGIEIGKGSYGVVKELDYRGQKCAGKEIHRVLYESATPEDRSAMLLRFEEECKLLSRLNHPNIVKFLGVYPGTSTQLPGLMMEYLPNGNLSDHLKKCSDLSDEITYGILRDVASGLRYLHEYSPPIIHRDLTANNVLLTTNMSAKISDLGVAKILDMSPADAARMTQTKCPGTPAYMPPEALAAHPKYTSKIDIFSFGVLIVHVLSGECPIPSEPFIEDPQDPSKLKPVTEFDRRRSTIEKIEDGHPLLGLIQQCLSNISDHRPDTVDIIHQITDAGYYDFLLIGKTGMGKSTLGNQLLQVEQVNHTMIRWFAMGALGLGMTVVSKASGAAHGAAQAVKHRFHPADDEQTSKQFTTADHLDSDDEKCESVTSECKLLANDESFVRVLDVPGFSDSKRVSKAAGVPVTAYEANLQTMRWIARVQAAMELRVKRVVYFLPIRGALEKADAILQEELQVMHYFFGTTIFNYMVVVATTFPRRRYQELGLDKKDMEQTKKAFHLALKRAVEDQEIECPPVVYIGRKDNDALKKIEEALKSKNENFELKFVDGVCSRCSITFRSLGQEKDVVDSTTYKASKCHPCFVQKFTRGQKIAGGLGHIATLGIVALAQTIRGVTIWPGFTNSDEECPTCKCSPGSPGCTKVEERVKIAPNKTIVVNHTNKL